MEKAKYVVDASLLLRRGKYEYYDENAFPTQWKNFDKLVEDGLIISVESVAEELDLKRKEEFKDWVKNHHYMFKSLDSKTSDFLLNDLSKRFPIWFYGLRNRKNAADPHLIAIAKVYGLVLVTLESYNGNVKNEKNYTIPTICDKLGAEICVNNMKEHYISHKNAPDFECISFSELIKREKLYEI